MFDYVKYKAPCKKCGHVLTGWQSKDGECLMNEVEPKDVRRFYDNCPKCKTWNEYKVIPQSIKIVGVKE